MNNFDEFKSVKSTTANDFREQNDDGMNNTDEFGKVNATKTRPIRQCRKQLSYKEQPDSPNSNTDDFGTCGLSIS
jgi:hypothetical protein